jgi:hypothetical protein
LEQDEAWWDKITRAVNSDDSIRRMAPLLSSIGLAVSAELLTKVEKLEKFKAYVHERFDKAGVSTNPDGPHSKEGCRVGDRFDLLIRERDEAVRGRDELLAKVAGVRENLETEYNKANRYDYRGGLIHAITIFDLAFPSDTAAGRAD